MMSTKNNLKVAVLGAGKIGIYHIREFIDAGCEVTSILGSSKESAKKKSEDLFAKYNIKVKAYHNLNDLLTNEDLSAVSICTPSHLHKKHIVECLRRDLHILCEKPLIMNSHQAYKTAKKLLDISRKKNIILTMNTQWPSIIPKISQYVDLNILDNLSIYMEPGKYGEDMLLDHLPHANSLLVNLIPGGKAEKIVLDSRSKKDFKINFEYKNKNTSCNVNYIFKFKKERPRKIIFSFNGKKFTRRISEGYRQGFTTEENFFYIEDPLKVSIQKFVNSVMGREKPLISESEILDNIALQDRILSCAKVYKKI